MKLRILLTMITGLAFASGEIVYAHDQPDAFSDPSIVRVQPVATDLEVHAKAKSIGAPSPALRVLPPCLVPLQLVGCFDGRYTACDASESAEYQLYQAAAVQGTKIKQDLEWLLKNASPAGKLYAALLLKRIDRAAGIRALQNLVSDKTEVVVFRPVGCVSATIPLSRAASELINLDKQGRLTEIMD